MAERMQLLQQARRMVEQNSGEASQKYKKVHDRTATEHNLQVGDKPDDGDYRLCSTMQLSSAAQPETPVTYQTHQVIFLVSGHFSTNVSYRHVKIHANKTQSSHNNTRTLWDLTKHRWYQRFGL